MALTKLHDINITIEDGKLSITPYKLEISSEGYFTGDYSSKGQGPTFTCAFNKRNHEIISHVLDLEEWELRGSWDGYDSWDTTETIAMGTPPERIQKWLDKLPEYELRMK
jgi:hypothetical protein